MSATTAMNGPGVVEGPKWIEFRLQPRPEKRKTDIWKVYPKAGGESALPLGDVSWYSHWRRYAFYPGPYSPVFEPTCLRDIADFCETKTQEHRKALAKELLR